MLRTEILFNYFVIIQQLLLENSRQKRLLCLFQQFLHIIHHELTNSDNGDALYPEIVQKIAEVYKWPDGEALELCKPKI